MTEPGGVEWVWPLQGATLPRDHAWALSMALQRHWPQWGADPDDAVLPLRLAEGEQDPAFLPLRARLVLRVSAERAASLVALDGCTLDVAGHAVRLGRGQPRALTLHGTLYAARVLDPGAATATTTDESTFMASVGQALSRQGVGADRICGRPSRLCIAGQMHTGFSLMLHGLSLDQSLRLQRLGLGPHRALGCGVFVPHKSAAPV